MLHDLVIAVNVHCDDIGPLVKIVATINHDTDRNFLFDKSLVLLVNQLHEQLGVGFLTLVDELVTD